ncbi:hypothetical protein LTS18_004242 [Coniosporium uncinatum]|uniref:Uncharacterized protein n=1 Tax=Coniosporium uncinatum TaxID=93489 RepID=A0ACC3DZN7_9PEZI|nr:hypothetical protein LTS18_004242 [Coniosporium uncinatum]
MHHVPLLGFSLALLSTVSAFVLPANQADGFYQVRRSASGSEIHESVKTAPSDRRTTTSSSSSAETHQLAKRGWGHTYCGCGIELSHDDTDAAVADLKAQLGDRSYINPGEAYYSVRGGVVAFVCNDDGNAPLKAWTDVVTQAAQQVTDSCGLYIAGSTGANFEFSIGYMQNSDGLDFCGSALSSGAGSC